ncbi:magnesium chelatase subunit I [Odoribacter laneus]|jgi:magnesium chelatase subunit I|uniref:AAA family ATPase n=1 Tax=Odoribacter laneus TaxID=626933 RepID=UPI0018979471|nr:MoxR family ATPase [Odoribacter laneus]GKI23100.1 magnesium chelatase subunit I [Odoribacter laneus]GKI26686.1 magnesium chelatase subunit I [Odoribacter laneus]
METQTEELKINFESRIDFTNLKDKLDSLRREIGRIIIGQQEWVDLLLTAILADGHVLVEGVPGVAKTLMAKVLARLIDADFCRIQFTPDLMPSDVLGTSVFMPSTGQFEYRKGPVFTNILLVDEINRSPAKTQAALFEVMEERQITNDGREYRMDYPFLVIATQNPVEHEGTYRLPEAQLDRFIFKISVGYPTFEEEMQVLRLHDSGEIMDWEKLSPVLGIEELEELRRQIMQVRVDEKIKAYIVRLVEMTRESGWLYLGASPRASLALMKGAKAYAALQGRDFVVPEDIIRLAQPVFRHRIQLSAERELEGVSVDQVITQLAAKVEVPR